MVRQLCKRVGVCILSLSMVVSSGAGIQAVQAADRKGAAVETKTGEIVLDGNDIKAGNVNGLTYKGFGLLSGNSTSDLLMDYKAENPEAYAELMQYLFGGDYPIFTHVKLEMGNDQNNSTGPESATMRTKGEKPNVRRNSGWQLAADAKKINPDLKVSILSWKTPAWVETIEDKYIWYKQTILAGYEEFGFMVDYINPNTNESWAGEDDVADTKTFAKLIAAESTKTLSDAKALELFKKIKLVISDEANVVSEEVGEYLKSDKEFFDATDVVGYHYKTADDKNGAMKWLAETMDKEVWNSEEQATFSNSAFRPANNVQDPTVVGTGIGGAASALEMGNTVIKSFVDSRRGHVIYQPVIGSFYEGGQYSFKELVSARDPWSGWMHYDAGLLVLAHVSKFAVTGWENEDNTAGIWRGVAEASKATAIQTASSNEVNGRNGGENYLTLASPAKDNFSTVVVNDSEYPMTYTLQTRNMNLPSDQKLELWETRAADDGAFNENYMNCLGDLSPDADGKYAFSVQPYSVVTVTSLDVSESAEHTRELPVEGDRTVLDTDSTGSVQNTDDGYLYADDFEYAGKTVPVLDGEGGFTEETEDYIASRGGDKGAMARYTHTVNGAFEVYKSGTGNYVLRQQLDKTSIGVGGAWNQGDAITLIGDYRWTNYTAAVDVMFERSASGQFAQIGIRQTGSSHKLTNSSGYSLEVSEEGTWKLYRSNESRSGRSKQLASGSLAEDNNVAEATKPGTWFQLKLRGEGNTIKAYINDNLIATYEDSVPVTSGRVALGCSNTYTRFDNLAVTKINGYTPYYTEYLDNMETYDLSPEKNTKLEYNDLWSRTCNQGMYVYQRTMSYSNAPGAAISYSFQGTGLEIIGSNQGLSGETGNTVDVIVDGEQVKTADPIWSAENMCTAYRIDGLAYGEHTVTVQVANGSLAVDAVAVLGEAYEGEEVQVQPKVGTESNLPEEELPKDLTGDVLPDINTPPTTTPTVKPDATPTPVTTPDASDGLKKGSAIESGNAKYIVTDITKKTVKYQKPSKKTITSVSVPATVKIKVGTKSETFQVTAISAKAFSGCKKLKKVTIGKNVETIDKEAFKSCSGLKKIVIKSTQLKKVGKNAIKGIHKKAVITCNKKKVKVYRKLFSAKSGFKKGMKVKA